MSKPTAVGRMLWASLAFSLMTVLVKVLAARVSPLEIIFWRCLLPLPVLVWLLRRRGLPLMATNRKLVGLRTVTGITAMGLFFFALGHLPLADAVMLARLQPLVVIVLSAVVLGEGASGLVMACLVASLVGTALVLQPSLAVGNLAGLAALGCAISSGIAHVVIRRLSADDDPMVIVLNFTALAAAAVLPILLAAWRWPSPGDFAILVVIAGLATAGQLLMTSAYALDAAPAPVTASYVRVALSVLWGFAFWNEIPSTPVWIGGAIIVVAGLVLFSRRAVGQAGAYRSPASASSTSTHETN